MKVELLCFDGCPGFAELLPRLRELLASEGIEEEVELRLVESAEEAERERFLGSPTVRIDGEDVDPTAKDRDDFGLECRLYRTRGGPGADAAGELDPCEAGPRGLMLERIDYQGLRRLLDEGAQLVEVLPAEEYAEEHLPGAINIPLKELDAESVAQLDKSRPVIVYCWDYLCDMSPRAAARLDSLDFVAYDYAASKVDYLARGLPREGEKANEKRAVDLLRNNVVRCGLADPIDQVRAQVKDSPYRFALVLDVGWRFARSAPPRRSRGRRRDGRGRDGGRPLDDPRRHLGGEASGAPRTRRAQLRHRHRSRRRADGDRLPRRPPGRLTCRAARVGSACAWLTLEPRHLS
jgi:rhodanese-related sulfurtransferase